MQGFDRTYPFEILSFTDMNGTQLRRIRENLGLSQVAMAARLGLHPNTLARQERAEVGIGEQCARLACAVYLKATRDRARLTAILRQTKGRTAGSTDRDLTLRAAERAEARALRELEEQLGRGALDWWKAESGRR